MGVISATIMLASALVAAAARRNVNPAMLGLALSNLMQMTMFIQLVVRQAGEVRAGRVGLHAPTQPSLLTLSRRLCLPSTLPPPSFTLDASLSLLGSTPGAVCSGLGLCLIFLAADPCCLAAAVNRPAMQAAHTHTHRRTPVAQVENNMTSTERMLEYTELPQEPPRVAEGGARPPSSWPGSGRLAFERVTARYRPGLKPVLRGITFSLPAGASCGVVGRTGSGKSSLALTLLRLIEVTGGRVVLDGVDVAGIGLDALRRQLAVIPQVRLAGAARCARIVARCGVRSAPLCAARCVLP